MRVIVHQRRKQRRGRGSGDEDPVFVNTNQISVRGGRSAGGQAPRGERVGSGEEVRGGVGGRSAEALCRHAIYVGDATASDEATLYDDVVRDKRRRGREEAPLADEVAVRGRREVDLRSVEGRRIEGALDGHVDLHVLRRANGLLIR